MIACAFDDGGRSRVAHAEPFAGHGRLLHLGRSDEGLVREMIEKHLRFTGSTLALAIVDDWEAARRKFIKVFPAEYKRALTEMHEAKAAGRAAVVKVAA